MKTHLQDISFTKYVGLSYESKKVYNYALRFGKIEPYDEFGLGEFVDQEFGFVKDMQEFICNQGMTWKEFLDEMSKKSGKTLKEICLLSIFKLQAARNYLYNQIQKINKIEANGLAYEPKDIEIQAGIDVFGKYRSFLQLDSLTGGDILKIDLIRKQPYSLCFAKLMLDHDKAIFEQRKNEILSRK